ncbi:MAG: DNA-directed RNA polymerase subunit alpha C-terminal domain-containing protein, partial [Candidatus Brocadiales bacterium]
AEIINPDLHIATLTGGVNFKVEMEVKKGRGYETAEENEPEEPEIGLIAVDSVFSPVRKVKFYTEDTRVGRKTNYDRLVIEMWTNGIASPEMALVEAAKILRKHLNPFVQLFEVGRELPSLEEKPGIEAAAEPKGELTDELQAKLEKAVGELDLSVRASNCLEAANIKTIGELVSLSEDEVMNIRNFGRTTLKEVEKKLVQLGLSFGTENKEKVSSDAA